MDPFDRWHQIIRSKAPHPNIAPDGNYYGAPEGVRDEELPDLNIFYISVESEGQAGLPIGVYIGTNISPKIYEAHPQQIVEAIGHKAVLDLAGKIMPGVTGELEIDVTRGISISPALVAVFEEGKQECIVFKVEPTPPDLFKLI
jgi:hypothetical protein